MTKVAIIGAGVSGLACADLLRAAHDVVLYESAALPGGHARTLALPASGPSPETFVDTGFIVYNEINYPLLTRYFAHLGVATQPSDMTFAVRYGEGELEFCSSSLNGLFAQRRNLVSPRYFAMLSDILKFFRHARAIQSQPDNPTLGDMIDQLRLGPWFRDRFLVPMGAAIWSTPPKDMLGFPAKTFVRFFDNHGLLSISGHHPWRTVTGGSKNYVSPIASRLGQDLKTSAKVVAVAPTAHPSNGFELRFADGASAEADEVVFACHADTALSLITTPTPAERSVLGAFTFRDNEAVLHRDPNLMPNARAAWASWVYAAGANETQQRVSVTYWMNRLQSLPGAPLFVSLNPDKAIDPGNILDRHNFRHPVFSAEAVAAQEQIPTIQGQRGLWFCGAWQRNGFHEDGLWSAVRVAEAKGITLPW